MGNTAFHYDALNDFGTLDGAGDFPNVMNMGEAQAERMTVDLKIPDGGISGALTLSVKGSDSEGGTYTAIVTGGVVSSADLNRDGYALPMPKTKFKFLKASVSGTFSGKVQALINSYTGV